jgi:hypothetical protein
VWHSITIIFRFRRTFCNRLEQTALSRTQSNSTGEDVGRDVMQGNGIQTALRGWLIRFTKIHLFYNQNGKNNLNNLICFFSKLLPVRGPGFIVSVLRNNAGIVWLVAGVWELRGIGIVTDRERLSRFSWRENNMIWYDMIWYDTTWHEMTLHNVT